MRAAGLDFESRKLAEFDLPEPGEPGEGEALLQIHEVGVCATDRELANFHFGAPPAGESVLALGHEAIGQVTALGAGVTAFQKGDWVAPMIRRPCAPVCAACLRSRMDLCLSGNYLERGINRCHGYFASKAIDPAANLVRLEEPLLDVAVLLEPLSVVEKAIEAAWRSAQMPPVTALVLGAGPVGLLTAIALVRRGIAVTCYSLEPTDHPRAQWARKAGVRYLNSSEAPPKANLVFEASGSPAALRLAFECMGPLSVLVLIGASEADLRFAGIRAVIENWTVAGVVNAARHHFSLALEDLRLLDRRLLAGLIERRPFGEWRESIAGRKDSIKTVHPLN